MDKYNHLVQTFKKFDLVGVAFSGGVDSTLVYHGACEALGQSNVLLLHGISPLVASTEQRYLGKVLTAMAVPVENIVQVAFDPLGVPGFAENTRDRCYLCKKKMYMDFISACESRECGVLVDGTNCDDLKVERPGYKAILELGVLTPLVEAGLSKVEIRSVAVRLQLLNHDKPANSCLATRIPEGVAISEKDLARVDRCESLLYEHGFIGCRARVEGRDIVLQLTEGQGARLFAHPVKDKLLQLSNGMECQRILVDLSRRA